MRIGKYVDISEAFTPEGFKGVQVGQVHTFNFDAVTGKQDKTSYKVMLKIRGGKKVWARIIELGTEEDFARHMGIPEEAIEMAKKTLDAQKAAQAKKDKKKTPAKKK